MPESESLGQKFCWCITHHTMQQDSDDLDAEDLWCPLVIGRLLPGVIQNYCNSKLLQEWAGAIKMAGPRKLVNPNGFLPALEEFPAVWADDSIKAWLNLWNGEMARAVNTIAPQHPLPQSGAKLVSSFTAELEGDDISGTETRAMMMGKSRPDQIRARAHWKC